LTICPCCGFKFHGALSSGCKQCGARAVGEPLPKPAHELPSYGRALVLAVSGSLVVLFFLTQTITAFVQHYSGSFGFWKWVAAGETAAWGLKWISIPVLFTILWFGRKLYRSILVQPERFCGVNHARRGLLASAIVAMLIALLIGITVPARLEQRKLAREAAIRAQGREIARAYAEYRIKYQTYPADKVELLKRLPDPYGTLAAALKNVDSRTYVSTAEYAANGIEKARNLRGVAIRNASVSSATDDTPPGGLSFTTYQLRLPGEDKIIGSEDDWIVRDGMVMKLSDVSKGSVGRFVSAGALEP
jgi:type II secretory pathway pseudopilin PulG